MLQQFFLAFHLAILNHQNNLSNLLCNKFTQL